MSVINSAPLAQHWAQCDHC